MPRFVTRAHAASIPGLCLPAACALVLACTLLSARPALADDAHLSTVQEPSGLDFQRVARQASDSAQAGEAIATLRAYLAGKPDSTYLPFARVMLVEALLTRKAPAGELLPAIDQAEKVMPDKIETRVEFYSSLGRALAERGIALDRALRYTTRAVALCDRTPDAGRPRAGA